MDENTLYATIKYLANGSIYTNVIAANETRLINGCKKPAAFIINTDPRSKSGEHWVLLMLFATKHLEWYDSFAKDPKFYNIKIPCNKSNNFAFYNTVVHQSNQSLLCGVFCLYVFYNRMICHRPYQQIMFCDFNNVNLNQNDGIVSRFYNSICRCDFIFYRKKKNCQVCKPRLKCQISI